MNDRLQWSGPASVCGWGVAGLAASLGSTLPSWLVLVAVACGLMFGIGGVLAPRVWYVHQNRVQRNREKNELTLRLQYGWPHEVKRVQLPSRPGARPRWGDLWILEDATAFFPDGSATFRLLDDELTLNLT